MARSGKSADINLFGDVTSMPWTDSDVTAGSFMADLEALGDVSDITVHISSYGGEVEEGLAIYNALLASKASVTTICEGQACSIASVIFMAGDVRIMRESSALFIHDCWCSAQGDADDFRKMADDLDRQMDALKTAYMRGGISEDDITSLLKADTWLTPQEAVDYGFATDIADDGTSDKVAAAARREVYDRIMRTNDEASSEDVSALTDAVNQLTEQVKTLEDLLKDADPTEPDGPDEPDEQEPEPEPEPEKPEPDMKKPGKTPAARFAAALNR
jgi:ATP-dependent Clp endopeptidase proteolytic subunit ClpP